MSFDKNPKSQEARVILLRTSAITAAHHTLGGSVAYNVDRDRVIVKVADTEIAALGPKEWFLDDDELQRLLLAAVLNNFGEGPNRYHTPNS